MIPNWLWQAVQDFWDKVGECPPFPRDLNHVVSLGYRLVTVCLPHLTVTRAETWLLERNAPYTFDTSDRPIRGCVYAIRGQGFIFVDSADHPDEQRFTIAHEIAHFLLDYWYPRQNAIHRLGDTILPVLDGIRPPTQMERLNAILRNVHFGIYVDLMERSTTGQIERGAIVHAEHRADQFACELIAPADDVQERFPIPKTMALPTQLPFLVHHLTDFYGLPASVAPLYARRFIRRDGKAATAAWLGI